MSTPGGFHLPAKPTGAQCNLDCAYRLFLSKEMLHPDSRFRMSEATLQAYLRRLVAAHSGLPEVTIPWQGGEPTLMGLDFFRRAVEVADALLEPGQRALHTLQTNGAGTRCDSSSSRRARRTWRRGTASRRGCSCTWTGRFTGILHTVTVDVSGELIVDPEAEMKMHLARQ